LAVYGPCWLGFKDRAAYTKAVAFAIKAASTAAHLMDALLDFGAKNELNAVVMHACSWPLCVQPAHLAWGYKSENRLHSEHVRAEPAGGARGPIRGWVPVLERRMRFCIGGQGTEGQEEVSKKQPKGTKWQEMEKDEELYKDLIRTWVENCPTRRRTTTKA
jgi:hypothetical protein